MPINISIITSWKNPLPLEALRFNAFHTPRTPRLCVSSYCIGSHSSVHISGRTFHRSIQTACSRGTLLDGGYPALYTFQHVGRHSSLLSYCTKSCDGCFRRLGTQGSVITAFNSEYSEMCVVQAGDLSSVSQPVAEQLECMTKVTSNARRNGPVGELQRVYQMIPFLPLNYVNFWFTYFRVWTALIHLVFIILPFQLLEPHHHHKASNHHIISRLMHHFYYSTPLLGNPNFICNRIIGVSI